MLVTQNLFPKNVHHYCLDKQFRSVQILVRNHPSQFLEFSCPKMPITIGWTGIFMARTLIKIYSSHFCLRKFSIPHFNGFLINFWWNTRVCSYQLYWAILVFWLQPHHCFFLLMVTSQITALYCCCLGSNITILKNCHGFNHNVSMTCQIPPPCPFHQNHLKESKVIFFHTRCSSNCP